jgi:single-stranded DNA-specific DHH superfamily exonuclease
VARHGAGIGERNNIIQRSILNNKGTTGAVILDLTFRSLGYTNYVVLMNERVFGNGINQTTVDTIKGILPVGLLISSDHGKIYN